MKRNRAFTLVELLVVVAIIALLVSILLPTLTRARDLAKRVMCASNSKNIWTAVQLYGETNNGWYCPNYYWDNSSPSLEQAGWDITAPIFTSYAYYSNGNGSAPQQPGAVVIAKFISNPALFYCPAQAQKTYTWAGQQKNWNTPQGYGVVYKNPSIGYYMNPHVKNPVSGAGGRATDSTMLCQRLPITGDKAFLIDLVYKIPYFTHQDQGVPGFNLAMGNGAVFFRTSQSLYNLAYALESQGTGNYIGASWESFDIGLTSLEKSQ